MPITLVQQAEVPTFLGVELFQPVTLGAAAQVGNTVVVSFGSFTYGAAFVSVTDDAGNTYVPANPAYNDIGTGVGGGVYYAQITKPGATVVTVSYGASTVQLPCVFVREWSGLLLLDQAPAPTDIPAAGSTSVTTGPTGTTSTADELIYHFIPITGQGVIAGDPSYTEISGGGIGITYDEYEVVSAVGAYFATVTIGASGSPFLGMIATFKSASNPQNAVFFGANS